MVTMDRKQGVEVMQIVKPQHVIPIHYNDYSELNNALSDSRDLLHVRRVSYHFSPTST